MLRMIRNLAFTLFVPPTLKYYIFSRQDMLDWLFTEFRIVAMPSKQFPYHPAPNFCEKKRVY